MSDDAKKLEQAVEWLRLRDSQRWLEYEGFRVGDDVPEVDGGFEVERTVRALAKAEKARGG